MSLLSDVGLGPHVDFSQRNFDGCKRITITSHVLMTWGTHNGTDLIAATWGSLSHAFCLFKLFS